jgi:hypothetical protein
VEPLDNILFYKRQINAEITDREGEKPYTMFKVYFYNPTTSRQQFLFAEEISADVYTIKPKITDPLTVWDISLDPGELKILKYGVYRDVQAPITSLAFREKEPEPTCSDGIKNQGEADVDCGGPCSSCAEPEAVETCFDSIQNQGEEGIDCGGPCSRICPEPEPEPIPIEVPEEPENKTGFFDKLIENYLAFLKIFFG